ncbi:hypothetical protein GDO86_001438 [Hymenochirus boettgeri]|uniref:MAM domain-containing protein n=1 Tax=Hymenochirus boettgeri TaxID=247094 RepID=A0A8T2KDN3_9PIPI|nr:hypothetical protein GDO86_001438 [Hymenochirus boettgeri]
MWLYYAVSALRLVEGKEIAPGSCTFEHSTCAFTSSYNPLQWTINTEGHYISVDTSQAKPGQSALLFSPDLHLAEWSCVRLVYQITGSESSPNPSNLNVYVRPEGESFDHLLWSAQEQSDRWLISSVDIKNTTKRFKVECDFEDNLLCGYMNSWNPNVNWFVGGGNIRNSHAILAKDHTLNNELGHYMYADSVHIKEFQGQEVAQLVSPLIATPISGCLSFYYQLKHENSNVFMVHTRDLHGSYNEIWNMGTVRQGEWNLAEVDLIAQVPLEVIFEVAFNGIQAGYVALDDISFSAVSCSGQQGFSFDVEKAGCDFEENTCHFHQDDKDGSGWSRVKVKPNAYRMGDHTNGFGHFMMANTRFTGQPGYFGRLYGPSLPGNIQYCLRFFYSLYGFYKTSDSLSVYIFEENHVVQDKIWSAHESPKGVWLQAEIHIDKPMPCKVVFMSWCKSFWDCGIAAIDDVSVSLGRCQTPDRIPPPGKCTFEKNDCGFHQEWQRRGMWHRTQGRTPTFYTGPNGDHTSGVGFYMYIEATNMVFGQKARMISRRLRSIPGKQCLTFFYHMYGAGTGFLNVYLRKESHFIKDGLLWTRKGEQGITWLKAHIEYESEKQHQIIFEAIRGVSIRSDIAIDDIMFENGPCKDYDDSIQSSGHSDNFNEIEF